MQQFRKWKIYSHLDKSAVSYSSIVHGQVALSTWKYITLPSGSQVASHKSQITLSSLSQVASHKSCLICHKSQSVHNIPKVLKPSRVAVLGLKFISFTVLSLLPVAIRSPLQTPCASCWWGAFELEKLSQLKSWQGGLAPKDHENECFILRSKSQIQIISNQNFPIYEFTTSHFTLAVRRPNQTLSCQFVTFCHCEISVAFVHIYCETFVLLVVVLN